jgi:hypothetical protein
MQSLLCRPKYDVKIALKRKNMRFYFSKIEKMCNFAIIKSEKTCKV